MKPEIKTKWVEALRSGEYQQGKYKLIENEKYCCLGVLSNLFAKEKGCDFPIEPFEVLRFDVVDWSGIDRTNPSLYFEDGHQSLTSLNDFVNLNFKELADLIEEQL